MKKSKLIALLCGFVFLFSFLAGCGGGGKDDNGGKLELLVDMHGYMPTLNTEPTPESPTVILSTRLIEEAFEEANSDIDIVWARSKPVGGLEAEVSQWFVTQFAGSNCPAIAFSWGTQYQDRDYYVDLTEYYNEPNEYVEGNEHWKDLFEDYLFDTSTIKDIKGQIVGVPISLYAGPSTGWYYNTDLVSEDEIPNNWEEFVSLAKKLNEDPDITAVAPWSFFKSISLDNWIMQFTIGPSIAAYIMDQTDYDKDGTTSTLEQLRATKAGLYNPVEHEYAREVYKQAKRYFTELLREGWMSTDYTPMWNDGKVALYEEGLWALSAQYNNTARDFEFGVFPAPLVDKNTTPYSVDIEYTENGPYQPEGDLILNIMKPAVEGKPELEAAAVKFLKFLTTPENISMIAEEMGSVLGSVKGSTYNSILDDWLNQSFPIVPDTNWPLAFNSDQNDRLNRLFGEWVLGSHSDSEFYEQVNSIQQAGADAYIKALNIDTSGWN